MRSKILLIALLVLTAQFVVAGAGDDQPTNIVVTTPYANQVTWAQVCWNTNNQSDSLVMVGRNLDFSRHVYDPTLTTNHCVVVKNLQTTNTYYYSVASCTDPVGGKECNKTDTHWSSAPYPDDALTFTTADSTSGPMAFTVFPWGPSYVYQNSAINVGITLIQNSGIASSDYVMVITEASVDGVSCLPGTLLGNRCGNTGISLTMLCAGNNEVVNPATNNYPVYLFSGAPYKNDYVCWNNYFREPAMEARLSATGSGQLRPATLNQSHNLRLMFQLVNTRQNGTPVGDPVVMTYKFSVLPQPQFQVTPATNFPPIPGVDDARFIAAKWGAGKCELLKTNNQAGIWLNSDFTHDASIYEPWSIFNYDGNRVFKDTAERFDGITGGQWQPNHQYAQGDMIATGGYNQVALYSGNSGATPPDFNPSVGQQTHDWGITWINTGNRDYWTKCSEIIGMQYLNWAVNIPKWSSTAEFNIFPWGTYLDFLRQGDVLNENCDGGPTCSGLNATADWRFGANILTYPTPGFQDQNFVHTYYVNQTGTIRPVPYNVNVLLVNWLETGVQPTNELKARLDLLIQTVSEAIEYNPLDGPQHYQCCYSASNWNVGLWAMTLINTYNVQNYMGSRPDARIPVELMKLLDWFYSTQVNLLGNDATFPYQPYAVPYNCSLFPNNNCDNNGGASSNMLIAPAYAWLGAVYGDSCQLPSSGTKCWDAADLLFAETWDHYTGNGKNFNQIFQDYSNYVGWRSGTLAGTDSYVLPTHNRLADPYPDVVGPYPAGVYPSKPIAANITGGGATITWYTYEQAVSTLVKVGTSPGNISVETDCGPSAYTGEDNLWINTCDISGLNPTTRYYFGVGGTDAAGNFAFSAVDPTVHLSGDTLTFKTTQ